MPIPTSRTNELGKISIDLQKCNGCGICVDVCKDFSLKMQDGKVVPADNPKFGCMACGHCMAICPKEAITIEGRFLSTADLFPLPDKSGKASYDALLNLFQRRRSIREFKDQPVEEEMLRKIIDAASTAPMGIPPSDVSVIVLNNKEKVRQFTVDFCTYLESLKWMVSRWFLIVARPFWGKENVQMLREFIKPMMNCFIDSMKQGTNLVTYDAPAALYFYGSPFTDPADPVVAATYAMTAAESLGLGTCMLGGIHPFIQNGKAAKKLREKYGIRFKSREGLFVIIGYPKFKFRDGIRRTFANIDTLN